MAAVNPTTGATPDDFAAQIAAAQQEIADGVTRAGLQRDPYGHALAALGAALGTFPGLVRHLEATRQPVRDDDLRRAVVQGIATHAGNVARTLVTRNVLIGAGMMVAALLIGGVGGWWYGYRDGVTAIPPFTTLPPAEAATWARLMSDNPGNAAASLRACQASAQRDPQGRLACALPVWLDPPAAVPTMR